MTDFYEMSCGCRFPRFDDAEKVKFNDVPSIEIDYYNINYNCPKIWDLMCQGLTVGIFQLEKSLGRDWSERIQPNCLEDVGALISVIRPGTLKAVMEDGVTAAVHFARRKRMDEEIQSLDETVDDIVKDTYGIILYQETAMQIAAKVAGFDLKQADSLRKAMGKKDAALMAKTRIEFIEGCRRTGIITDSKAIFLFDIIEKSNRYSFNKSISPNSLCQLENGNLKTIDELNIGDFIKTPYGFSEVLNKFEHGELSTYEVELENGKKIECSIHHKFLCTDGIFPLWQILKENKSIISE